MKLLVLKGNGRVLVWWMGSYGHILNHLFMKTDGSSKRRRYVILPGARLSKFRSLRTNLFHTPFQTVQTGGVSSYWQWQTTTTMWYFYEFKNRNQRQVPSRLSCWRWPRYMTWSAITQWFTQAPYFRRLLNPESKFRPFPVVRGFPHEKLKRIPTLRLAIWLLLTAQHWKSLNWI